MFCNRCGAQLGNEAKFCPKCGTRFGQAGADEQKTSHTPDVEEFVPANSTPTEADDHEPAAEAPKSGEARGEKRFGGKIVFAGIAAVAVIVALVAVTFVLSMPPGLSDDQILSDLNAEGMASGELTVSQWGANDGYQIVSQTVQAIDDTTYGETKAREATVEIVLENESFSIVSTWMVDYVLQDKNWISNGQYEYARTTAPLGGVSDEKLVNQVPSFLQRVDQSPYKDSEGNKLYLEKLYSQGVDFAVIENSTSESGGSAKLSLSATGGFAAYKGTLTVDFSWNGSDWEVVNCSVDEGAYKADYSSMVATWTGELAMPKGSGEKQYCYVGKTQPATMTVKSVDANAMTAKVDIAFTHHSHEKPENAAEACEGDASVTCSDILIPLKMSSTSPYLVYESSEPSYEIRLCFQDDGTIKMETESSYSYSTGGTLNFRYTDTQSDTFVMKKTA